LDYKQQIKFFAKNSIDGSYFSGVGNDWLKIEGKKISDWLFY